MIKFSGIENPYGLGKFDVEKNAKVLQRYRFIHEAFMKVMAGQMPAREDWHLKQGLGRAIYEDAEAADMMRKRIVELRTSSAVLNYEPDATLSLLMDELIHANNDLELLVGIYAVIKPAMLQTYEHHMANTQQIVDQPTVRILQRIMFDLQAQIKWGQELIEHIRQESLYPEGAKEFEEKISGFLNASGGIDGSKEKSASLPQRWRSTKSYTLPLKAVRDPRKMGPTTLASTGVANPPQDKTLNYLYSMMRWRQEEMGAAEILAAVLYAQKGMPWEFYFDVARHLWDEVRHTMFGQAALEAEGLDWMSRPQYTTDYDVNAPKMSAVQYTWLTIGIEEWLMKYPGKKAEYEFCKNEAKHALMALFQDYDWADEVNHAKFGRKWTPELFGEDIGFVRQIAKQETDQFWQRYNHAQKRWEEHQEY